MRTSYFIVFFSLAAFSSAITVTSPNQGTTWSSSGPNTVTWTSVSTDPTTFAVTLVQQGVFKQTLADNVDGTKGSLTVTTSLPVGSTFQVNLVKSSQDLSTILAQSAQFNISQSSSSSGSSASNPSTATTSPTTTGSSAGSSGSTGGSSTAGTGTSIPNASDTTTPRPNAASYSAQCHGALIGVLALFSVALA